MRKFTLSTLVVLLTTIIYAQNESNLPSLTFSTGFEKIQNETTRAVVKSFKYHNEEFEKGIAMEGVTKYGMLIKIKSADLEAYKGKKIDYVRFFSKEMEYNSSCYLVIREGKVDNKGYEQVVDRSALTDLDFNMLELITPYEIVGGKDLFVGIMMEGTGASLAYDNDGLTEKGVSDIMYGYYQDQDNYWTLGDFQISGDFMLEAMITDGNGTSIIERTANINVYPNPFNNEISISNLEGENTVYIKNALGQIVNSYNTQNNSIAISTSHLSNGIYIITIEGNGQNPYSQKLIKH